MQNQVPQNDTVRTADMFDDYMDYAAPVCDLPKLTAEGTVARIANLGLDVGPGSAKHYADGRLTRISNSD